MHLLKGPWVDYATRTLLEEDVFEWVGYEQVAGDFYVEIAPGEAASNMESRMFDKRYRYRDFLRRCLDDHALPKQPGPTPRRQQRHEAVDLYLKQNEDADPLTIAAIGLAITSYGRHEDIYIGPLLRKLNDLSTPRGMSGSEPILERMKKSGAAEVKRGDSHKDSTVVRLNDGHHAVEFLRTALNIHTNQ